MAVAAIRRRLSSCPGGAASDARLARLFDRRRVAAQPSSVAVTIRPT